MKGEILVNIESVDDFSKEIKDKSNRVIEIMEELISLTQYMEKFYNSNIWNKLKEVIITCLKESKNKCEEFNELGYRVEGINQIYKNVYIETGKKVKE